MRISATLSTAMACALLVLSISSCGQSTSAAGDATAKPTTTTAAPSTAGGPECTVDQITVTPNFGSAPTVTLPKNCSTPTALLSKDIVTGTGPAIQKGDMVSVDYQLTTWSNDQMVQQSFGTQPYPTQIGVGRVIPGWDQGMIGMKAGGRRLLVVPPALGYGSTAQQGIKANETLLFVVDVHSVTAGS
jgi:peptidylprolyl isomerase